MFHPRNILAAFGLVLLLGAAPLVNPAVDDGALQDSLSLRSDQGGGIQPASFRSEGDCLPSAIPRRLAQAIRYVTTNAPDRSVRERSL